MTSSFKSIGYLFHKEDEFERKINEKIKEKKRIEDPELMFNLED